MTFTHAIVRTPAATFSHGISTAELGVPRLELALAQHVQYCDALRRCGLKLTVLEAEPAFPDSTFVEDTAVVAGRHAMLARPGAASRAGEIASMGAELEHRFDVVARIEAPGTLDGGDVCEAGERYFIGVSERTNPEGARQFATFVKRGGYEATLVDIRNTDAVHLKSGMAYLGEETFVTTAEMLQRLDVGRARVLRVDPAEEYAANCVRVNDFVLLPAGNPRLETELQDAGLAPLVLDVSEFRKMDGGLSCLSIRF